MGTYWDNFLIEYPWISGAKLPTILQAFWHYCKDTEDLGKVIQRAREECNKPAVMHSFVLDELRARAKVYQDNYYAVGLDEVERNEWYASWKAMEEAIYIIEHPSKTNDA